MGDEERLRKAIEQLDGLEAVNVHAAKAALAEKLSDIGRIKDVLQKRRDAAIEAREAVEGLRLHELKEGTREDAP
jgi:hypothetical protein